MENIRFAFQNFSLTYKQKNLPIFKNYFLRLLDYFYNQTVPLDIFFFYEFLLWSLFLSSQFDYFLNNQQDLQKLFLFHKKVNFDFEIENFIIPETILNKYQKEIAISGSTPNHDIYFKIVIKKIIEFLQKTEKSNLSPYFIKCLIKHKIDFFDTQAKKLIIKKNQKNVFLLLAKFLKKKQEYENVFNFEIKNEIFECYIKTKLFEAEIENLELFKNLLFDSTKKYLNYFEKGEFENIQECLSEIYLNSKEKSDIKIIFLKLFETNLEETFSSFLGQMISCFQEISENQETEEQKTEKNGQEVIKEKIRHRPDYLTLLYIDYIEKKMKSKLEVDEIYSIKEESKKKLKNLKTHILDFLKFLLSLLILKYFIILDNITFDDQSSFLILQNKIKDLFFFLNLNDFNQKIKIILIESVLIFINQIYFFWEKDYSKNSQFAEQDLFEI